MIESNRIWPNKAETELLKACLLSGRFAKEAWEAWTALVDFDAIDCASYNLLPLAARNPDLAGLQDPIFEKSKGVYRRNWVENQLRWGKLVSTFTQLIESGVDRIVLLKGMAMILYFYRDFGARVMGDVDILIKREHLSKAISFLRGSGWGQNASRFDAGNEEHLKRWHALNFTHPSQLNLDLHWSFLLENSPSVDEKVLKDAIYLKENRLYVPNPADLLLQTCVHGVKYSPVPLIRWIVDAMTILKQSEWKIEWDRFVELAHQAHVCWPLCLALEYLVQEFDASVPENVIQRLKSRPSIRLEHLEYKFNARGWPKVAAWYRYCLNRGHLTKKAQIFNALKYLQVTACLKSPWQIPPFAIYWIFKRIWNSASRSFRKISDGFTR